MNEASLQEVTTLFEEMPPQVIMRAFDDVDNNDIAIFLLMLDTTTVADANREKSNEIQEILSHSAGDTLVKERAKDALSVQAQKLFAQFPFERQVRIAEEIIATEMVDRQQAEQIWNDLVAKMKGALENTLFFGNGAENLTKLLAHVEISEQNRLVDALARTKPALANTVSKQLLVFDNLAELPDEAILTLLQVLETNTLALALHNAPEVMQDRFFRNMSEAQADAVEAASEQLTFEEKRVGEAARESVVNLVRKFAAKGILKIQ